MHFSSQLYHFGQTSFGKNDHYSECHNVERAVAFTTSLPSLRSSSSHHCRIRKSKLRKTSTPREDLWMGKPRLVPIDEHNLEMRRRSKPPRSSQSGCIDCCSNNVGSGRDVGDVKGCLVNVGKEREAEDAEDSSEDGGASRKRRLLEDIYRNGPSTAHALSRQAKYHSYIMTRNAKKNKYDNLVCKNCKRGDGEQEMLLCDGCDQGFHLYCVCPILIRVPKGEWLCSLCSKRNRTPDLPLVQTKLIDFFHIQRPLAIYTEGKKRKRQSLCVYKKKRKLLPHVPSRDPARRLQQMASLAAALMSTGVEFSDELTYMPGLAPESANCAALERGGIQALGKEDKATFDLCKLMCSRGEWPPLMVTHDSRQGFVVEADSHIKDMTLIAEYTGDVDYMQNRMQDESDSIMGLLFTDDPSKELVICPDKRGNIARFISGINNHTLEGRKKQNLRCVRFDIAGQSRAILVSIRDISKGERLYYDYNAFRREYPTQHFV